jgi:hypothetical protein|tara:strand:- start:432 stop:1103 length:672 start_codon:yes stop_codon:yes gene_type:complete
MPTIDQAVNSYENSIDDAINGFQQDVENLQEEGLSTVEILGIIAAIDFTTYFIEDLRFSTAVNSFMATTEDILSDLPSFGNPREIQLVALQTLQRQSIEGVTRNVTNVMRNAMIAGLNSGLTGDRLKETMQTAVTVNIPRIQNVIGTMLGDYRRAVIGAMAVDLPKDTLYEYIGPDDEKTRPVCRTYLSSDPLNVSEIRSVKADGFEHGGGVNCRHYWSPIDV